MKVKTQNWLLGVMCLVMLFLTLRQVGLASQLSCDECTFGFKSELFVSQGNEKEIVVKVQDLYNEWIEGRCIVTWDENLGFQQKLNLTEP